MILWVIIILFVVMLMFLENIIFYMRKGVNCFKREKNLLFGNGYCYVRK